MYWCCLTAFLVKLWTKVNRFNPACFWRKIFTAILVVVQDAKNETAQKWSNRKLKIPVMQKWCYNCLKERSECCSYKSVQTQKTFIYWIESEVCGSEPSSIKRESKTAWLYWSSHTILAFLARRVFWLNHAMHFGEIVKGHESESLPKFTYFSSFP